MNINRMVSKAVSASQAPRTIAKASGRGPEDADTAAAVEPPVKAVGEQESSSPRQPSKIEERYFGIAKMATAAAAETDLVTRAKAQVSDATAATYAEVYARRLKRSSQGTVTAAALLEGVSRASWHGTRAAIMYRLAHDASTAKANAEAAFKAGNLKIATAWAERRYLLATIAKDVMKFSAPIERRKRQTKRATIPTDPDWRAKAFEVATYAQKAGVALLWASGCRPAEVESGVDVTLIEEEGRRLLRIDVPGAKVGEYSGQPKRVITIDANSDPGSALLSVMGELISITIRRKAAVLNNDFSRIRERMKRTGGADWSISPYSMRHQMSADAKVHFAEIFNEDEAVDSVATLLGHRVTRSQGRYGHPSQAKGGGGLVAVTATYEIKESRGRSKTKSPPKKTAKPAAIN